MILLSIGTNIGNKTENIKNAVDCLEKIGKIISVSRIYQTEPWGFVSQNSFYNLVISMDTALSAIELLDATQEIERQLGRTAKTYDEYADRIIDIDIIDYNSEIVKTSRLTLPHANMHKRNFVLFPLCDVAPDWIHPVLNLTALELKENSRDKDIPVLI